MTTNIDDAVERLTKDCTLPRPTLGMYYSSMEDIRIVLAGLIARDAEIKRRTEQLVAANALADKRGTEIARLRAEITTRQSAAMEALDDGDCSGALAILKNFVLGPMA